MLLFYMLQIFLQNQLLMHLDLILIQFHLLLHNCIQNVLIFLLYFLLQFSIILIFYHYGLPIIYHLEYFLFFPKLDLDTCYLANMELNICYIILLILVLTMNMCEFHLLHMLLVIHLLLFLAILRQIVL